MDNLFVIEGQAGSGKTPLIKLMKFILEKEGFNVSVCCPFTFANEYIIKNNMVNEFPLGVYTCWNKSKESALFAEKLILNHILEFIQLNKKSKKDIVLFDRYWLTMCMSIRDSCFENKSEKISKYLNKKISTFFLDTHQKITQSRQSWDERLPWTNENIDYDFETRRNYINSYSNLLGRDLVEMERVDLEKIAKKWSEIIISKINY